MNQAETKRRQAEAFSDILMLVAVYVIGRQIGDRGTAYMAVAAQTCALLWIAVSGCMSDTLGRLLRSRRNKGQYRNIGRMRGSAMVCQAALGLAGSLLLMVCSGAIAEHVFRISYSGLILLALSPMVLLRTVSAVLIGYFQGEGSELPRALAGILRPVFLCGFGLFFGHLLGGYGEKVSSLLRQENFTYMYSGVGIAVAAGLAELFVILFLGLIFRGSRGSEKKARQEGMYSTDSVWECVMYLHSGRWPQLLTAFLLFFPLTLGLVFLVSAAEEGDGAGCALEYGLYAGKYLVVCGIGVALISILALPVIARVFQCFKRDEHRFARTVFQSGAHICLVHGIFLAVYVAVMSGQIAGLLDEENAEAVAKMLQGGSGVIAFGALSGFFIRFLHAMGKKYPVLIAVCGGNILFLVTVLPSIRKIGILALVYGVLAGTFLLCVLLWAFAFRQMRVRMDWVGILIVPVGAGGVAGLVCLLAGKALSPHLGNLMTLAAAFVAAETVYWILLLVLRNFKEQELEAIPGGKLIGMLGQLLRVY